MRDERMKTGIREDDVEPAARGGVALLRRPQVGSYRFERLVHFQQCNPSTPIEVTTRSSFDLRQAQDDTAHDDKRQDDIVTLRMTQEGQDDSSATA